MVYQPGHIVKVQYKDKMYKAEIMQPTEMYDEYEFTWWVKLLHNGDVTVYTENDIIKWNIVLDCNCGGWLTKQPGHSYWCDAFEE